METVTEPMHFENYEQLLTALHASRNHGADPAALSLLEFAHERIFRDPNPQDNFDIHVFTTDPNFAKVKRSIIESVIAASRETEATPYLAIAATSLLEYLKATSR